MPSHEHQADTVMVHTSTQPLHVSSGAAGFLSVLGTRWGRAALSHRGWRHRGASTTTAPRAQRLRRHGAGLRGHKDAQALEERLREHGSAHTRAGLRGAGRSPQHPPWVISVDGALSRQRDRHHTKPRGLPDGHSERCLQGCIPSTACICPQPPRCFPALQTTQKCILTLCCLESFPQTQELPELVLKRSGKVRLDPRAGHLPSPY